MGSELPRQLPRVAGHRAPTGQELREVERRGLMAFVRRFPQVHLAIGLLGNGLFITGSLMFLTGHQRLGVYTFLAGSCGMFLGSLGEVLRSLGRRRLRGRHGEDP